MFLLYQMVLIIHPHQTVSDVISVERISTMREMHNSTVIIPP